MAQVRKRISKNGVSWQIDYFDPNGKLELLRRLNNLNDPGDTKDQEQGTQEIDYG